VEHATDCRVHGSGGTWRNSSVNMNYVLSLYHHLRISVLSHKCRWNRSISNLDSIGQCPLERIRRVWNNCAGGSAVGSISLHVDSSTASGQSHLLSFNFCGIHLDARSKQALRLFFASLREYNVELRKGDPRSGGFGVDVRRGWNNLQRVSYCTRKWLYNECYPSPNFVCPWSPTEVSRCHRLVDSPGSLWVEWVVLRWLSCGRT